MCTGSISCLSQSIIFIPGWLFHRLLGLKFLAQFFQIVVKFQNRGEVSTWSTVMKCLHIILILFVHCFYLSCEIKSYHHSLTSCNIGSGFLIFFPLNLTKARLLDYTILTHKKTSINSNFDFHKAYFQLTKTKSDSNRSNLSLNVALFKAPYLLTQKL